MITTNDQESASTLLKKRNVMKCLACIVAGLIFHTLIIMIIVLIAMNVGNPKAQLSGVSIEYLSTNFSSDSSSFSMKLDVQVCVKNANFGHFKFENTIARIAYKGAQVGEFVINKARVRARSTKRFNVTVYLNSEKLSTNLDWKYDLDSGIFSLGILAKLHGKIQLFKVIKKKKNAEMNCNMDVNAILKEIQNLKCK